MSESSSSLTDELHQPIHKMRTDLAQIAEGLAAPALPPFETLQLRDRAEHVEEELDQLVNILARVKT